MDKQLVGQGGHVMGPEVVDSLYNHWKQSLGP